MIIICNYCGKEFDTNEVRRRKYCSEECRIAAKKEYYKHYTRSYKYTPNHPRKTKGNKIKSICVICGAEFWAWRRNQVCCSEQCCKERKKQYGKKYNELYSISGGKCSGNPIIAEPQPEYIKKGIEYHLLSADEKLFYGDTQSKAYADDFKVIIPEGLKKAKDRQK